VSRRVASTDLSSFSTRPNGPFVFLLNVYIRKKSPFSYATLQKFFVDEISKIFLRASVRKSPPFADVL
jgi:hypothetical protein